MAQFLRGLILGYRKIPWRRECRCRPGGPSCSEVGLAAARAGVLTVGMTVALASGCGGSPGAGTPCFNPPCSAGECCPGQAPGPANQPAPNPPPPGADKCQNPDSSPGSITCSD